MAKLGLRSAAAPTKVPGGGRETYERGDDRIWVDLKQTLQPEGVRKTSTAKHTKAVTGQ